MYPSTNTANNRKSTNIGDVGTPVTASNLYSNVVSNNGLGGGFKNGIKNPFVPVISNGANYNVQTNGNNTTSNNNSSSNSSTGNNGAGYVLNASGSSTTPSNKGSSGIGDLSSSKFTNSSLGSGFASSSMNNTMNQFTSSSLNSPSSTKESDGYNKKKLSATTYIHQPPIIVNNSGSNNNNNIQNSTTNSNYRSAGNKPTSLDEASSNNHQFIKQSANNNNQLNFNYYTNPNQFSNQHPLQHFTNLHSTNHHHHHNHSNHSHNHHNHNNNRASKYLNPPSANLITYPVNNVLLKKTNSLKAPQPRTPIIPPPPAPATTQPLNPYQHLLHQHHHHHHQDHNGSTTQPNVVSIISPSLTSHHPSFNKNHLSNSSAKTTPSNNLLNTSLNTSSVSNSPSVSSNRKSLNNPSGSNNSDSAKLVSTSNITLTSSSSPTSSSAASSNPFTTPVSGASPPSSNEQATPTGGVILRTPTGRAASPLQLQNLVQSPQPPTRTRSRSRSKTIQPTTTTQNLNSLNTVSKHNSVYIPSNNNITSNGGGILPLKAKIITNLANNRPASVSNEAISSSSSSKTNGNSLKQALQNIELKMRIIASPNIRIADLFKCFLKNVPKSTETIESLVHYGDNIGAKIVKCLINENLYESQSLLNQEYDIYQGPALCVTYDAILKDEHWDEIFINNDEELQTSLNGGATGKSKTRPGSSANAKSSQSKNPSPEDPTSGNLAQYASKFMSFFHISDFIAILSGYKVAFVDPYERIASDERSYVAMFDLENDTTDIDQFEDQFKPLEKIFNVPLLKNRYYNGTIIRLPLRTQTSSCSVSSKLVHVKDILINAKDFMKEAHLHILFAKNVSSIQFCRTKDGQNIEKIYSINVEDNCVESFRQKYKKINDAIAEGEFPRTSTVMISLKKQIETKIEKTEWILSIFADTMRLLNSNYFLMKLAIPVSENCDKDLRFSHKSNLISSDTGFIKTLHLTKPIICYIEDKEGILMSHFCRLNISDSLKLSHFNDAYALMLKDLTKIIRKDPTLLWSLMPDLDKNVEFGELLGDIWQELAKHELFYSCTEGWGYVAIEDMIINDAENLSILQEILTKVYSETNYPVVIMPPHVLKALQKHSPKDSLQIMTPSQTSDILHNNIGLIEQLKPNQKLELLRYLIKEPSNTTVNESSAAGNITSPLSSQWPASAARFVLELPLLFLANNKFIKFQPPSKTKAVYLVEKEYTSLFNVDTLQSFQFINSDLPKDLLQILKKFDFQRLTQLQMISDSELSELISVPKEWRLGEERILWPMSHEKFNLEWLERLWKYLAEYCTNDLTALENFNIIYYLPTTSKTSTVSSNSSNLILYKLSKNSNLVYTPAYQLSGDEAASATDNMNEETYFSLIRILNKLGFQCVDALSPQMLSHSLFSNYVPNIRATRVNLLKALRNKYKNSSSSATSSYQLKLIQDFNLLLNDADIKLLQLYLSKIEISKSGTSELTQNEDKSLLEFMKEVPLFENSALECSDRYLPLKESSFIYDTPIRLPFELTGLKPFLFVVENEAKLLIIEKLGLELVKDFSLIIKEIVKYCTTSKDLYFLNNVKIHLLGKWILLNCASYLAANPELSNIVRQSKLFLNQNQELCAPIQFINPLYKEKHLAIIDPKCLPAKDLNEEKCISVLRDYLKMRNCLQLKVDEVIDLYESTLKQSDANRRMLAELIIEILNTRVQEVLSSSGTSAKDASIDKILNEYSTAKAINLRHFLMSVNWLPLKTERPMSYPPSLVWKGGEASSDSVIGSTNTKFSSPRDCVSSQYALCTGSVICVSDLDISATPELRNYFDLKPVELDLVVRHLKLCTRCFESSAIKSEWYDYLTVSKKCYEFMKKFNPIEINRELKSNDLSEWIWNGAGYSALGSVFIIKDKDHPLCTHVATLPYELYEFVEFFEKLGMKKLPETGQLEQILLKYARANQKLSKSGNLVDQNLVLENAAKNYPLINWIKQNHPNDSKLTSVIKEYEDSLSFIGPNANGIINGQFNKHLPTFSNSLNDSTSSTMSSSSSTSHSPSATRDNSFTFIDADSHSSPPSSPLSFSDSYIYLYLPEQYKSPEIRENLIGSIQTLIKSKQIKMLDEEGFLAMRKQHQQANVNGTQKNSNLFDHYRVYNEIILPNLNSLSKNVKDAVVLFALDNADPKMLEILRDHPCIPVTPMGRKLKKPNKLIHPLSRLAALYSDSDERFPCGSEDTYIREDRLQILKILGMKCDQISWAELVERAEAISKMKEFDLSLDRAVLVLSLLNEKLASQPNSLTMNGNGKSHNKVHHEEKDARVKACDILKDIAFVPVKLRPYSSRLALAWCGDKYKFRFAKPKELMSAQFEQLCSSVWPIPLHEHKSIENVVSKQIEQYFGFDESSGKLSIRDVLKHLEEISKLNLTSGSVDHFDVDPQNGVGIVDSRELKMVTDMCFRIYDYVQQECMRRPNELCPLIREFFAENQVLLLVDSTCEFVRSTQLCWNINFSLRPIYFHIPTIYLRHYKYLFGQVLNIKLNLDMPDLLHVVDTFKRKYKDTPINSKEDFSILLSAYGLMIDLGYSSISNLYLPNVNCVLYPGPLLNFYNNAEIAATERPDEFVHPAVDRRICILARANVSKKNGLVQAGVDQTTTSSSVSLSGPSLASPANSSRLFPRVFGNKRLEGILARLDDEKIDINFINLMDEGNPQIVLDYLLEANRIHSLNAFLSEDDVFVILKYFNDFLARNYQLGTFYRLKELKIFKPLWSEKYINLNFTVAASLSNSSSMSSLFNASFPQNNLAGLAASSVAGVSGQNLTSNVYLISEELASLLKKSFKTSPFITAPGMKSASSIITVVDPNSSSNSPLVILVKRNELSKLYAHLNLINLNDMDSFVHLALSQFKKLDAKSQFNFLKYLFDDVMEKCYIHEKEKCFKLLRDKLFIQSRRGEQQAITELYDTKSETLRHILTDSHFPDEVFDSPQCLRSLREAGLRTYLPSELCKKNMNEIEESVQENGWTEELREKSKWLYQHLVENWQRFDDSVLQQRFLEPYSPVNQKLIELKRPFEFDQYRKTCLKLSDAELSKYEQLCWTSSYILPKFVDTQSLDLNTTEFLKLNRKPCFSLVNQHLMNICESIGKKSANLSTDASKPSEADLSELDDLLVSTLSCIYKYLEELTSNENNHKDTFKQLEDKEIVWSSTNRRFVAPSRVCVQLDPVDEIPPFVYSLGPSLRQFKNLFFRLGAKDKPYAMLYGDILRKMAKVCADDYLNSNELCKALKAMECFFKYLKQNNEGPTPMTGGVETVSPHHKLPGLYFVTTELKLEKSNQVILIDTRDNMDDIGKLKDKFMFNPSEKVFKINTADIKPLVDKIFISQRPTLFSQKYEVTYDFTLPNDPDSNRQSILTSLERKYQQLFTSRQLHRSLARCISNKEARQSSPKHLPIDEVEKVIRERLSAIKVTCVEYLETALSFRKIAQKIDNTVEEKACFLTHESSQFATIYISKKHVEQPYFPLCLARSLQPLLVDLNFEYSIFTSLIATSVSQMNKLLQLVNVATEENILSVIKLQYVPSSGKLYGDDINLLALYDPKLHNVLIGDLCVFCNQEGAYIYCQIMKIIAKPKEGAEFVSSSSNINSVEYEFVVQVDETAEKTARVNQHELYVLENWHRIYDAMLAKPPDERESFKYNESSNGKDKNNADTSSNESANGKRADYDNDYSTASDSEKSDTSSPYGSTENLSNGMEQIEQAKAEINEELRTIWSGLDENERKKRINKMLLKWHPDKNPGQEKYAAEVFKHLKKQIELFKTDPFLAGFYRSSYSPYTGSAFSSSSTYGASSGADDYKSKHYGSFDDLHRKGSTGGSPHSSPSRDGYHHPGSSAYDNYDTKTGPGGASNLGRAGSFRQEWERRRQQKRNAAGSDPRDRSSPSSARKRGTDFTQMDANLWFTQAKSDLDAANNDMHPITGKPAYEWVCYKCYRAVEKALRAYHYFKGNGKLPATDIPGLLINVDSNIRDIAFRFCNFIGHEANAMQNPGVARFGKTPNEVFPLTKAEQALDYGKELVKLVEDVIYAN